MTSGPAGVLARPGAAAVAATLAFATVWGIALHSGFDRLAIGAVAGAVAIVAVAMKPERGLLLAMVLIPLEAAGQVLPGVSVLTWAKVALAVTAFAYAARVVTKDEKLELPRGTGALVVTLGVMLMASAAWTGGTASVWGIVAFTGQTAMLVLVRNLVRDPAAMDRLIASMVIGSVPVVGVTLADIVLGRSSLGVVANQLYASESGGVFRVTGTFVDPNALGRYLAFALAVTLCAWSVPRFGRFRVPLALLVALQGFCLLNTFSRGALAAAAVVAALYLLWQRGVASRAAWAAVGAACVAALVLWNDRVLLALTERLWAGGAYLDLTRVDIYGMGAELFWRSPVYGFGPDNVARALGTVAGRSLSPHSLYLEVLLGVGMVGAAALGVFVAGRVRGAMLARGTALEPYARVALLALGAVLLSGLTLHGMQENELWLSLALLAAVEAMARSARETGPPPAVKAGGA